MTFGSGFENNIADAYRPLMQVYEPGDWVYLFGFSRGAYTARAPAGMLQSVDLLSPGAEHLIRYAMTYWRNDHGATSPGGILCAEFEATLARKCPVRFVGVWDTVGSVGYGSELLARSNSFPFTYTNPSVAHVRHAVSIDERRHIFRQNLMAPIGGQDVKNVWFAGVHANVGGGDPSAEAGLAKIAFGWMMREAVTCGLEIDPVALDCELNWVGSPPDFRAGKHDSLKGGWWVAEFLPARQYNWVTKARDWRISFNRARNVPRESAQSHVYLHQSVIDRINARVGYAPGNIPNDEATLRARFKIEA